MCCQYRIYYHLNHQFIPISDKRDQYSQYATSSIVNIIASQNSVDPGHVCTEVPNRVQGNVSFHVCY